MHTKNISRKGRKSEYCVLVREIKLYDKEYFFKMCRMSLQKFELLLSWIAPSIMKTSRRRSVASPAERLCVTLCYLSTGNAQITLATCYHISPAVVGRVVKETTEAIWNNLKEQKFIDPPTHPRSWLEIANDNNGIFLIALELSTKSMWSFKLHHVVGHFILIIRKPIALFSLQYAMLITRLYWLMLVIMVDKTMVEYTQIVKSGMLLITIYCKSHLLV